MKRVIVGVLLAMTVVLLPSTAHAGVPKGYGLQASAIAKSIGCKNVSHRSGNSQFTHSGLVCYLSGYRINIITFDSVGQQKAWIDLVPAAYPHGGYVATANGMVSVAKDGNRNAAKVAAHALHGTVVHV
jgi:hypothetical protein